MPGLKTSARAAAADGHDTARCLRDLQAALREMAEVGHPTNARAAGTILRSLASHGPALDAQQFLSVYGAIKRAHDRSRAIPGAWYDTPDRARWRLIVTHSRACLMALTRAWRVRVVSRRSAVTAGRWVAAATLLGR